MSKITQVWYVQGADPDARFPEFFATKEMAERYAREIFPDEDESARYARIYFRTLHWIY